MSQRVAFFFDWQNVYKRARESFHDSYAKPHCGQVHPLELANAILEKYTAGTGNDAHIHQVRIYRGRPNGSLDPNAYNAFQRQTSKWAMNNKIVPTYSDLRYPEDWDAHTRSGSYPVREKGIDVALAVDVVDLANKREYDHAVVMSADYDLVPAVKRVYEARLRDPSAPSINVAAWQGNDRVKPLRIRFGTNLPYCHWLSQEDYWGIQDETDYTASTIISRPSSPRPGPFMPTIR